MILINWRNKHKSARYNITWKSMRDSEIICYTEYQEQLVKQYEMLHGVCGHRQRQHTPRSLCNSREIYWSNLVYIEGLKHPVLNHCLVQTTDWPDLHTAQLPELSFLKWEVCSLGWNVIGWSLCRFESNLSLPHLRTCFTSRLAKAEGLIWPNLFSSYKLAATMTMNKK